MVSQCGDTTSFLWAETEIQLPENIKLRIKTVLIQAGFLSREMLFEGRALWNKLLLLEWILFQILSARCYVCNIWVGVLFTTFMYKLFLINIIKVCTSCWNLYSSFPDLNVVNVWKQALILLNPAFILFLSWPWEQFLHQPQLTSWGKIGDRCSSASEVQTSARAGIANCCDTLITWTVSVGFTHGPFFIRQSAVVCRQAACKWSLWFLWLVLQ